ncbi:MAG: ABC transporter substrate-binding protein [Deltaproteobacteria bacterium]|nr:ABC transporter substrate-binding protein [Deltaproteobacteria bacterium]
MKKIINTAIVILATILLLPGCTGSDKDDGTITVGFSQIGAESAWRVANTESIRSEAAKRPNIKLIFSDAQQKQENQIKAIRNFIAQGVDVIAFSPVVETGFEAVLREAKDAGIPVILIDRAVDVQDDSLWVTFMGSDFVEEGRRAARWLIEKGYTNVKIVELQGTVGSAPAIDRKKGFEEVIKDHPGMVVIKSQSGNFTRSGGKEIMEAFLKTDGKEINVLFSHNDDMAIGAIQAIEEYGLAPGKDIIIVSIDAVRGAFEAMIEGKLNCTVECSPLLGPQMFDAVEALAKGESIPKKIVTEEGVFPQETAAEAIGSRKY